MASWAMENVEPWQPSVMVPSMVFFKLGVTQTSVQIECSMLTLLIFKLQRKRWVWNGRKGCSSFINFTKFKTVHFWLMSVVSCLQRLRAQWWRPLPWQVPNTSRGPRSSPLFCPRSHHHPTRYSAVSVSHHLSWYQYHTPRNRNNSR